MSNTKSHRGYSHGQTSFSWSQNYTSSRSSARNRYMRTCAFRIIPGQSEFSPVEFLKHLAERVATALRSVSTERRKTKGRRHLAEDSSSSSSLGRSNSKPGGGGSVDSYRSDAVEDCIEFIHSSFSRSNSSTSSLHTH